LGYEFGRLSLIFFYVYFGYLNVRTFREWGVPFFIRLLFAWLVGALAVAIAVNVAHLSSHLPSFRKPTLSYLLGWLTLDVCIGFSYDIWLHEHLVGHHQYTNIITIDPNIPESHEEDIFRCSPNQAWYKRYAYQFLWVPMMAFMVLVDYRLATHRYWVKGLRRNIRINYEFLNTRAKILFFSAKLLWFIRVIILPIFFWECPVWEALVMLIMSEIAAGYFVGINLPINHTTDKVDWPLIKKDEKTGGTYIDQEWAVEQVRTCKDYAHESWFFNNLFGGLNNHATHHLLPALHHSYYIEVYPIVKQCARDWNIEIPDVATYYEVIYDFVHNLWNLSADPPKMMHF